MLLLVIGASAEAGGLFRCRSRQYVVCPPPDGQRDRKYYGERYILNLATSIGKAALQVHSDKNLGDAAKKEPLLKEFEKQIGDVARRPDLLGRIIPAEGLMSLENFNNFMQGEVQQIASQIP
jgi:hypothetical protein